MDKLSFEGAITARHGISSISFHIVENLTQRIALKMAEVVSFGRIEGFRRRAQTRVAV